MASHNATVKTNSVFQEGGTAHHMHERTLHRGTLHALEELLKGLMCSRLRFAHVYFDKRKPFCAQSSPSSSALFLEGSLRASNPVKTCHGSCNNRLNHHRCPSSPSSAAGEKSNRAPFLSRYCQILVDSFWQYCKKYIFIYIKTPTISFLRAEPLPCVAAGILEYWIFPQIHH